MSMLRLVLMIVALVLFGLAAIGWRGLDPVRLRPIAGGLFCWALTLVLPTLGKG